MVQPNIQDDLPEPFSERKFLYMKVRKIISSPVNIGIGVIGLIISAAIIAPSFLNEANGAKQSEARLDLGNKARMQQNYFENNSKLTTRISDLNFPNKKESEYYTYEILDSGSNNFQQIVAIANKPTMKSYTAVLRRAYSPKLGKDIFVYNICESLTNKVSLITDQQLQGLDMKKPLCPSNFRANGEVEIGMYLTLDK